MNPYYPVFLDIKARRCAVIGGGAVALRKVNSLIDHGASVTVVSPEICQELRELSDKGVIQWSRHGYQPGDLDGVYVAIVASNHNDVNVKVAREAKVKGILVNVVDEPWISDFIVPACVERGDMTIAISTGGSSPALARKIRTRLEKEFGEEFGVLVRLIGEVRKDCLSRGIKIEGDEWQEAMDLDVMVDMLKKGDLHKVKAYLFDNLTKKSGLTRNE